jgi:phosphoribosyl 1,2-cyclic phosphodiesterase
MGIYFKSICSSSSGNGLMLWTGKSCVLIDCGFGSQISCEKTLSKQFLQKPAVNAVVVTHNHGDHINYSSLRVLEKYGLPVRIHESSVNQLQEKHFMGHRFDRLTLEPFSDGSFEAGDLCFQPIKVPHQPDYPTYGFSIRCRQEGLWRKVVIASDLYDGQSILEHLIDADFIYIESNHDPALLALYPNYNSHFHMSNSKTGELLYISRGKSKRIPKAVMLGHLSFQRNKAELALHSIRAIFKNGGLKPDFKIYVAPRYEASSTIEIVG